MIEKVLNMLHKSLESFIKQDALLAQQVCDIDDEVDYLKREMKSLILNKMKENPSNLESLMTMITNSRHLERIADLCTNIAEDVIYQVKGTIVRHSR